LVTYANLPEDSTWIHRGLIPVGKGEAGVLLRAPETGSITNAETAFAKLSNTYANPPDGSVLTNTGIVPAENGDPATALKAPFVALIVNAETPPPWFAQ
jgi:hypothetical protein